MTETVRELKTMIDVMEIAENQNLSATGAYRHGLERIQQIALNVDNTNRRGLYLILLTYRTVYNTVATERMRDRLRNDIADFEQQEDIEISQQSVTAMLDMVEDISFDDTAMARSGDRASLKNIYTQIEMSDNIDQSIMTMFEEFVSQTLSEVNPSMINSSQNFLTSIANSLPPDPDEEDWKNAYYEMTRLLGELDEEGRYLGDI